MTELRFETQGWSHYGWGLIFLGVGIVFVLMGGLTAIWNPLSWGGAMYIVAGVGVAAVGLLFVVLILAIYVGGTIEAWRKWRQLRYPAVLVDASGIRYLARRRPLLIPWADVEQVGLDRTILRTGYVDARFSARLRPGSAVLNSGSVPIPADRVVRLGALSQVSAPEDVVVRFLEGAAGLPLTVTEVDRRPAETGGSSR